MIRDIVWHKEQGKMADCLGVTPARQQELDAYASRQLLLVDDLPLSVQAHFRGGYNASAHIVKELVQQRQQIIKERQEAQRKARETALTDV